jgi:uncharacterized glyoxalase superfamily protein PhnB
MAVIERSVAIDEVVPLLFVEDIHRSVDFYCGQLGFELVSKWEPNGKLGWCRIERGDSALMLQQACDEDGPATGRGRGVGFFFLCDDANALYDEFRAAGLAVEPPKVAFYGMNQFFVRDPDGYGLCFQNVAQQS